MLCSTEVTPLLKDNSLKTLNLCGNRAVAKIFNTHDKRLQ